MPSSAANLRYLTETLVDRLLSLGVSALILGAYFLGRYEKKSHKEQIALFRARLEQRLRMHRYPANDPRVQLDPDDSTLLLALDDARYHHGEERAMGSMHRIYRNKAGEYFLVTMESTSPPLITLLSQDRARGALHSYPDLFHLEFGEPRVFLPGDRQ